ncbi:MAG: c-di-GMP-binding flagellar brake protein YcgR [Phenylobacterium sp.]
MYLVVIGGRVITAAIIDRADVPVAHNENYFELLPGKMVDLQVNHPAVVRLKLKLVGYEAGQYILLRHPDGDRQKNHSDVLVEGNVVIVRYLLEGDKGECCAFRSTIRQITQYPQKMIVLSYPVHIENRQLRLHQRVSVHLPAQISLFSEQADQQGAKIKGVIGDISERGCSFIFKTENPKATVKKRKVNVVLKSPEGDTVVIPGRVCNCRNEQGKMNVGIQFVDADEQVKELLEQLFILTDVM